MIPEEQRVLANVQSLLDQHQPRNYTLVLNGDARFEGGWWYVGVHPSRNDVQASQYARLLEEIENEYRGLHTDEMLLVPSLYED